MTSNANPTQDNSRDDQSKPSRNIPHGIAREVRQRCGFGCVICGLPLYDYEHMEPWATVKCHVASNITLLCSQHHDEKTRGLLPVHVVRKADQDPFNKRQGVSKPYDLHYSGSNLMVGLGNNTLIASASDLAIAVMVDEQPLIAFSKEDGHILLHVRAFDKNNNLVLQIANNQLMYSISQWDITLTGRDLIIRGGSGVFFLDITFAVPDKISINRGHLLCNGVEVVIESNYVALANDGRAISNTRAEGPVAFGIGRMPHGMGAAFVWGEVPRYDCDRDANLKSIANVFSQM